MNETPDYFEICTNIAAQLSDIPGLRAVDAEQAATQRQAPAGSTAVVVFAGEVVNEHIGDATLAVSQSYDVIVMCRGARTIGASDGQLIHAAIQALHGSRPTSSGRLLYTGSSSDFEDNARYYTLNFRLTRVVSF